MLKICLSAGLGVVLLNKLVKENFLLSSTMTYTPSCLQVLLPLYSLRLPFLEACLVWPNIFYKNQKGEVFDLKLYSNDYNRYLSKYHNMAVPTCSIESIALILQLSLYFWILSKYIPSFNQSKPTWSL